MNEEQLIEFVNWLPSVVPEFKNATPDQIVQALNQMSESDEGQQMLSQLINTFQQAKQSADSQMFKKGGKLAAFVSKYGKGGEMCCKKKAILQGGIVNKISEKMQDGGELATLISTETLNNLGLIPKAQPGMDTSKLRQRGTTPAYIGNTDYNPADSTWISSKNKIGADIKNIFNGNTLRQYVVTDGVWGTPRKAYREITNYNIPAQSDTIYVDADGKRGVRNPSFLQKIAGDAQHSTGFMNSLDTILKGYDPIQLSGKEVKQSKTK